MLKKYDGLFIFAGSVKDEALEKALQRVNAEIERLGGSVDATDNLGRRAFARPMQKRENGVYVKVQFQLDPSKVGTLRVRFRLNEDVFRMQVLIRDERLEVARAADHQRRVAHRASVDAATASSLAAAAAEGETDGE